MRRTQRGNVVVYYSGRGYYMPSSRGWLRIWEQVPSCTRGARWVDNEETLFNGTTRGVNTP